MKTADDIHPNLSDIQGNILRAYRHPCAVYLFFRFASAAVGEQWLSHLLEVGITSSKTWEKDSNTGFPQKPSVTINCALTFTGLKSVGVAPHRLALLPTAFREGMYSRSELLGDVGMGAHDQWEHQLHDASIHIMVMVNAENQGARKMCVDALRQKATSIGVIEVASAIFADALPEQREHFGFHDGIGQPSIEGGLVNEPGMGVPASGDTWRPLKPGEFLLGYTPEREAPPLPPTLVDLCFNGTYVVFRKLKQDVAAFRTFVREASLIAFGSDSQDAQERLAANLVGRWRSGAPLALFPEQDPGIANNDFRYRSDPLGERCPIGAHIRRTNPRDALGNDTHVPFHRILRRGLTYGPPFDEEPDADRGLVFLAINADIEAQFEFVQEQWINKGEFAGLSTDERDPIAGANADGQFTLPSATSSPFIFGLTQFVTTRGGGYFLMPGIRALELLASGKLKE